MAAAAVRHPANAPTIAAMTELLWVMHRSRLLAQQGTPAMALVIHLARIGPMRSIDLADTMNLNQSTVSRHLAHLEESGLVARTPDPDDGRAHLITVTPAGCEAAQQHVTARVHQLEQVIDEWPERDRADLARLLTRFTDGFTAQLDDPPDPAAPGPARAPAQKDVR